MGAGNYQFPIGREVYVNNEGIYGDYISDESRYDCQAYTEDQDALLFEFEDFEGSIMEELPKSFRALSRDERFWVSPEAQVIAQNGLHNIVVVEWQGVYVVVGVLPREDLSEHTEQLALSRLDEVADKLFDNLYTRYGKHLNVRHCAWTSKPYQPIHTSPQREVA